MRQRDRPMFGSREKTGGKSVISSGGGGLVYEKNGYRRRRKAKPGRGCRVGLESDNGRIRIPAE